MFKLSEIYIYPIKSLGGIRLDKTNITTRGLENDRRFMLTDENGRFLTQREHPELAIFQTQIVGEKLIITNKKDGSSVKVKAQYSLADAENHPINVQIWDDETTAIEVSKEASEWFTQALKYPTRLVYMHEESKRKTDPDFDIVGDEINSFSDGYPVLIAGQSSLDDLNNRLEFPVNINRFRTNFVFTGGEAFDEDTWHEFNIGNVKFFGVKPCSRCIMTTIDQETGEKKGREPLFTLMKYRKAGKKILFGHNVLVSELGTVSVGDDVTVISRRQLEQFKLE